MSQSLSRRVRCVLLMGLGACARPLTPAVVPAPAPAVPPPVPAGSATGIIGATASTTASGGRAVAGGGVARDTVDVTPSEVARETARVFGDSAAVAPTVDGPSWDIDVRSFATHDRVEHYVNLFAGSAKEHFVSRLERGTRYEGMIRAKLRAGGLPEDMYYLALIESGFNPDAYSRAAAVGMWQFMSSTARGIGLRVDPWVDERRDPVRSTDGAVRFINDLNRQFGSLYLAAAAYNGGPGRVSRGLRKFEDDLTGTTGDSLFFALAEKDYLRPETKNYVPQLVAAAMIGKDPGRYGLAPVSQAVFVYDTVRVPGQTPLAAVARAAGVQTPAVSSLNPHVLRGMTPPGAAFLLRIPVGTSEGFTDRFAALDSGETRATVALKAKKGETAAKFATRAGVPLRTLSWFNASVGKGKKVRLSAGQLVRIPTSDVIAASRDVPDPSIEKYGSSKKGRGATMHVVRSGETLASVARRYGTTTKRLMALNRLKRPVIIPGQSLVVRGSTGAKGVKRGAAKSAKSARVGTAKAGAKAGTKSSAKKTPATKPQVKKKTKASANAKANA